MSALLDDRKGVADAVAGLEVQGRSLRNQPAGSHDGDAVGQQIGLLHGVRRQHYRAARPAAPYHLPCEPARTAAPPLNFYNFPWKLRCI